MPRIVPPMARITRVEFDREDGETLAVETSDGVVVELRPRVLWRSVPNAAGAGVLEAGRWVVVSQRKGARE